MKKWFEPEEVVKAWSNGVGSIDERKPTRAEVLAALERVCDAAYSHGFANAWENQDEPELTELNGAKDVIVDLIERLTDET
jgi:hypothetical protein